MVFRERRERGVVRLSGGSLAAYPVGSVYFNTTNVDPTTLFGGTWVRFAKGQVLVGLDEAQIEFDTPLETGGEKTHLLTEAELPKHTHGSGTLVTNQTGSGHTHDAGSLTVSQRGGVGTAAGAAKGNTTIVSDAQVQGATSSTGSGHTHGVSGETANGSGGAGAHNNLQPFCVVYMWRRTA